MCRLLFIIGASETKNIRPFMYHAKEEMSKGNNDGLGYTAIKNDGDIFTERWLKNDDMFNTTTFIDDEMLNRFSNFIEEEKEYTLQGQPEWDKVTSVMMHTRYATCSKGMNNVHPFVSDDGKVAVVHNGVIRNHDKFEKLNSTCDSEVLLTEYMRRNIDYNFFGIQDLVNDLEGYWAIGTTAVDQEGVRFIDIHRDNASATLYMTFVEQLGGYVLATREEIITYAIDKMGWEHNNRIFKVKAHSAVRFNAIDGEVMQQFSWEKKKPATHTTCKINKNNVTYINKSKPTVVEDDDRQVELIDSNFLIAYEHVFEDAGRTDKYYQTVKLLEEDMPIMPDEVIKMLEEAEDKLTDEEMEELNNLPYDLIPEYLKDVLAEKEA